MGGGWYISHKHLFKKNFPLISGAGISMGCSRGQCLCWETLIKLCTGTQWKNPAFCNLRLPTWRPKLLCDTECDIRDESRFLSPGYPERWLGLISEHRTQLPCPGKSELWGDGMGEKGRLYFILLTTGVKRLSLWMSYRSLFISPEHAFSGDWGLLSFLYFGACVPRDSDTQPVWGAIHSLGCQSPPTLLGAEVR